MTLFTYDVFLENVLSKDKVLVSPKAVPDP